MTRARFWFAVSIAVILVSFAVSNLERNCQTSRQINQQHPNTDTQNSNGNVTISPEAPDQQHQEPRYEKAIDAAHADFCSAYTFLDKRNHLQLIFDAFVALFTGVLAWTTAQQWRGSTVLERAQLFVEELEVANFFPASKIEDNRITSLIFCLKNYGRSTAWLIDLNVRFQITDQYNQMPTPPQYFAEPTSLKGEAIPKDGKLYRITYLEQGVLDDDLFKKVESAQRFLVTYGFVRYRDAFNRVREIGFGRQYNVFARKLSERSQFQAIKVEGYNYEK